MEWQPRPSQEASACTIAIGHRKGSGKKCLKHTKSRSGWRAK